LLTVPESSTKAIGRAPRLLAGGGGQSWLVGYSPPRALSPGVQASPSLGPALHLLLVGSQIGHDWMNVLQLPLGQSAFVMQPRLAFAPPTQAAVSQVPELGQSASLQHAVPAASGPRQRPVSLTQVPPGHEPASTVPQPPLPVQFAPGVDPPEHRIAIRSASRKMPELSGTFRPVVEPVEQFAVPAALAVIELMTQLLVAAPWWERFGIGSGGPNRQPAFVHCRNLHVPPGQSAAVVQALW